MGATRARGSGPSFSWSPEGPGSPAAVPRAHSCAALGLPQPHALPHAAAARLQPGCARGRAPPPQKDEERRENISDNCLFALRKEKKGLSAESVSSRPSTCLRARGAALGARTGPGGGAGLGGARRGSVRVCRQRAMWLQLTDRSGPPPSRSRGPQPRLVRCGVRPVGVSCRSAPRSA